MEQLQRGLWILILCIWMVSPIYCSYRQNVYYLKTWEGVQAELFFEDICIKGYCTSEDYLGFCEKMTKICRGKQVIFEEFQRGFGKNGTEYRIYISWDEIREEIETGGEYIFSTGSEIRMYFGEQGYFGLVKGGK